MSKSQNRKVGEIGLRRSVSSDEQNTDQMYILSFKVTFQEIPLIGTCTINVQEGWKPLQQNVFLVTKISEEIFFVAKSIALVRKYEFHH